MILLTSLDVYFQPFIQNIFPDVKKNINKDWTTTRSESPISPRVKKSLENRKIFIAPWINSGSTHFSNWYTLILWRSWASPIERKLLSGSLKVFDVPSIVILLVSFIEIRHHSHKSDLSVSTPGTFPFSCVLFAPPSLRLDFRISKSRSGEFDHKLFPQTVWSKVGFLEQLGSSWFVTRDVGKVFFPLSPLLSPL